MGRGLEKKKGEKVIWIVLLEKLVNSVRNAITEITVINYTEKVA